MTLPIDTLTIDTLRRLANEATPGPWLAGFEAEGWHSREYWRVPIGPGKIAATHFGANADFIVLLRNNADALLDVAEASERLRAAVADAIEDLEAAHASYDGVVDASDLAARLRAALQPPATLAEETA